MRTETTTENIYNHADLSLAENSEIFERVVRKFEVDTGYIFDEAKESIKGFHKFFDFSQSGSHSWLTFSLNTYEDVEEMVGIELQEWFLANYSLEEISKCCPLTGVCYDETLLEPIRNFLLNRDYSDETFNTTDLETLLKTCFEDLGMEIESESEYRNSYSGIMEEIENNDFEFYENGEMI